MNRDSFIKVILFLFPLMMISWFSEDVMAADPNFDFDIRSHHLQIKIDPSNHLLRAEDRLEIDLKKRDASIFSFLINPKLRINRVIDLKTGKMLHGSEDSLSAQAKLFNISIGKTEGSLSLLISYEGPIYDPVAKEGQLQFVRGDQTSGLISPEGVYLDSSSHWYPDRPHSISTFNVEATIPAPYRIVTQGELLSEKLEEGVWKSQWTDSHPTESLTLVAGNYSVNRRDVGGIKISTYFFQEDDRFSEAFLNATEEYLTIYSNLLGPYPFKKFDIVQNFFASGYGIPTFTLLAPDAIRQGKEFLRPGALDHEVVHSWWGHFVSGKPNEGNWVEALTTYCTNYYYKELKLGEEDARKHRQDVLQKYAIQVPVSKDYPLRKFLGKSDELDGQIGYGKGSMVFHMLRQMVGKDLFFATLRKFSKQFGDKQAGWEEIKKVFEGASEKNLDRFFSQWLDRPEGPRLKLENIGVKIQPKGYQITGEVVQEGEVYELLLPVEVDDGEKKREFLLKISERRQTFSVETPRLPLTLTIDPDTHLFRRHYPEEILPGLNALLEDPDKIFVIPDGKDQEKNKIYLDLVKMTQAKKGGEVFPVKEMTEDRILKSSLMFLGESWKDPIFSLLFSKLPGGVRLEKGTWVVNGKKVEEKGDSLLLTFPHPLRPGKFVSLYFGNSNQALSRARYIFFYGWDSYLIFIEGRPAERGSFSPDNKFTSHLFSSDGKIFRIDSHRLKDHVSYLASPELAGRRPGTTEYEKAQAYLIKQIEEMGIRPVIQPFSITVQDIQKTELILQTSKGEANRKAIPLRHSKEGEWKGLSLHYDLKKSEKISDLSGKAVLLLNVSKDLFHKPLFEKVKEFQSKGAKAILIFAREEDLDAAAPYITYPSYFPPGLESRWKKKAETGHFSLRTIEASKVSSQAEKPDFPIDIPVLFVPYSQGETGWMKSLYDEEKVFVQVSVHFKEMEFKDANIGGILSGNDPAKKGEILILGAHYDHLGRDEGTGVYYPGADDNASGVSALLEIGRSLMNRRTDLKRSLIFLFFGGEEWGLWGSRYFLENPPVLLNQIKAMLSVDSIGGATEEKEVFLVGGSVYPSLAQRSRRFLPFLGIREGPNIDRYAFLFGSDHFPFHQREIPAIDFFASDQRKFHTLQDRLESIDFEKLMEVTKLIYLTSYEFLTEP